MTVTDEPPAELLRVGDVTLDLARQVVWRGDDEVRLRPKTFDVLTVLVRQAGSVVSKQRLIESVWGDVAVTDDSLVQCLMEIRRALGDAHGAIRTVRGRGYLLDGEVQRLTRPRALDIEPEAGSAAALAPPPVTLSSNGAASVSPPAGSRSVFRAAPIVALLAVAVAATAVALYEPGSKDISSGPGLQDSTNPAARRALDDGLALSQGARAQAQTDMHKARELFERAVALDDGYAAAHAALGNALVQLAVFGIEPAQKVLPQALVEARRAVSLDPTLAAGWQALAHAQTQGEWNWTGAEESYRRAVALDPAAKFNMIFAHLLVGIGRTADAVAESDQRLAFDPGSSMRHGSNCVVKYLARRFADAVAACDRGLAINPDESLAHFWRALALTALGRNDEAMNAALSARRDMGFVPTWLVGYIHARAGRLDQAREVLRAVEARAATTYVPPIEVAFLAAAVGDRANALDWLERAYRAGGPLIELIAVHPAADPLRAEPRFRAILKALRLPDLS